MNRNRSDLSNWIIHFIHDRNLKLEPKVDPYGWNEDTIHSFDYDGKIIPEEYPLLTPYSSTHHDSAFEVLQTIIHCGYLKASYSFRKTKKGDIVPTIYGPKPAVCFTEMPFSSFLDYTKSRNDSQNITPYGIAFHRSDLFNLGARPVIYGISGEHKESTPDDIFYGIGHRTLHSNCGIGPKEQYRYVYTRLSGQYPVDWTHEREWRWADTTERYDTPGLPFLLDILNYNLNGIFVLVRTEEEVSCLQHVAQRQYHQKGNYVSDFYNLRVLGDLRIISLEALSEKSANLQQVRFEDFAPLKVIKKLPRHKPSAALKEQVKVEVGEALKILDEFEKQMAAIKTSADTHIQRDDLAFISIITWEATTELTQAMLDIGYLKVDDNRYIVSHDRLSSLGCTTAPHFTLARKAFEKVADYLTIKLSQKFYCEYNFDGD